MGWISIIRYAAALGLAGLICSVQAQAQSTRTVGFAVSGGDEDLEEDLQAASALVALLSEGGDPAARDVVGAALSDYARMVETLYANGYYSGVVRIGVNGREAAELPLLNLPARIDTLSIRVETGPPFRFGRAAIGPLAPGTAPLPTFRTGEPAPSGVIREAAAQAVGDWRDIGHAKATPSGQSITANHATATLDAEVRLAPGPRVRFGKLVQTTPSAVRSTAIRRIAGLPQGEVFSPDTLRTVARRLRRTGAFSSVALEESDTLGPDDTMDILLTVADEKPRRYGFGAELSTLEGLNLSAFWLHRNAFGGAQRLRFDAEINQIGGGDNGMDFATGVRIDFPAIFGPDTTGNVRARLEHLDEPDFTSDTFEIAVGATRYVSEDIEIAAGVGLLYSQTDDAFGSRDFTLLTFPLAATRDQRDNRLDPTGGFYINLEATPFVGVSGSATGARLYGDLRGYRSFGSGDRAPVLALRLQLGSIVGAGLSDTYPDYLFFSGGGGTVRGQPYQSLGVDQPGGLTSGGRSFVGASIEARVPVSEKIGIVAFADTGYIGSESFYDGSGEWHSGAGIGVRYKTGLGPIRFDVAAPVSGNTGEGVQVYIGIGQAF